MSQGDYGLKHHVKGMSFTFAARDDRHVTWTGAAIIDDRFLYPWNDEVCSFTGNSVLDPPEPVKYDGPVPCINCGDRKCVNLSDLFTILSFSQEKQNIVPNHLQACTPVCILSYGFRSRTHYLKVKIFQQLTIVQCRVYDATTDGKGQTQLSNGLKKLGHDGNLLAA